MPIQVYGGRIGRGGGVRGGHKGADVLHLHAGRALENKGGPCAHVRVPRDGGVRARVVLGGASEDFGRGGRENNLDWKVQNDHRFQRWHTCGLCEQMYHGVVECALSWACWKTTWRRPEGDWAYNVAISVLGNGLASARHHKESLSVREAELSMILRTGGAQHQHSHCAGNMCNRVWARTAEKGLADATEDILWMVEPQGRGTL